MSDAAERLSATKRALLDQLRRGEMSDDAGARQVILPSARSGPVPLSYAQQQFWVLQQLAPDASVYHHLLSILLPETLHVAALEQSLAEIIRRHEAWRTSFSAAQGQPTQRIHPPSPFRLEYTDLSSLAAASQEQETQRLQADLVRAFDLAHSPPLRLHLIQEETGYRLFVALHHIVFDGWALFQVFLPELATLYEAYSAGRPSPLPNLPIQYADYAIWQRSTLNPYVLHADLDYWKQQLADLPAALHLPADFRRPPTSKARSAYRSFALPAAFREGLGALSRQESASLFMAGLAAFACLLARYSGQYDVVVGTPATGRAYPELERLLGVCLNTLALRVSLSDDPSFRELLRRVRQTVLAAFEHSTLPFEEVVRAVQPERIWGKNPLFQVMFTLEGTLPSLPTGWAIEQETAVIREGAVVDLRLGLEDRPEGLTGYVEYAADLFEEATILRLIGHFQTMLGAIIHDPDQRLSELPLLDEAEQHQLLVEWNATEVAYPQDQPVHRLFEAQAERAPASIALICEDQKLSYHELNQRANQLAQYLQKRGVGPEVRVGLCMDRSIEMVVSLLGILKAGGAYVPLDPTYLRERLAFMLEDTQAPVVLTTQTFLATLPPFGGACLCLDTDWPSISAEPSENLKGGAGAGHLAYVMYTSGSTGKPKGVQVLHRNITRLVIGTSYADLDETKTFLHLAPISFDASTFEIWGALLHGARCVLAPEGVLSLSYLGKLISTHQVTTLWLTAALFNTVIDEAPDILRPVRQVLTGGEALSVTHIRRALDLLPATEFINGYGPTEGTTFTCCYPIPRSLDAQLTSIPIGRPISNTRVYIVDTHLRPVPIGVPGELLIGGDGLASGYLHRPDLTREKFIADPWSHDPDARLYKTGDLVRWRADGTIEFLGRLDDQIKISGHRIEPGEIETMLRQHPHVGDAVVVAREDSPSQKRMVAYLVPKQSDSVTPVGEVWSWLREQLPAYMVPTAMMWLSRLPVTPVGKVDRHALPEPKPVALAAPQRFVAPRTTTEKHLAALWEELLGVQPMGVEANFFELGGYSLLATKLVAQLASQFGITLPIAWLFQYPILRDLAAAIDEALPGLRVSGGRQLEQQESSPPPAVQPAPPHMPAGFAGAITLETHDLRELVTSGLLPQVDSVAVGYLFDDFPTSHRQAVLDLFQGQPVLTNLLECSLGRIGVITLPLFGDELYADQGRLVQLCRQAREMTKEIGGRMMALTGLLPSASGYGQAIVTGGGRHPVAITTGHATTTAVVVAAIERILREAGRHLAQESVAFVGALGSVGSATLRLMLATLPHPKELLLCDVYSRGVALETMQHEIRALGFKGEIHLLSSVRLSLPERIYTASVIVGATNVPDVLDIARVRPGSLVIDDSGPHCFKVRHAIERFERSADILFTEGGALQAPALVQEVVYAPLAWRLVVEDVNRLRSSHDAANIMGCVLSGLLSAQFPHLLPTIGEVVTEAAVLHLAQLKTLGYQAAPLHCEGYRLSDEIIAGFRQRYSTPESEASNTTGSVSHVR